MVHAWGRLLESRKFWLGVCDVVISLITYFVTRYLAPDYAKDVLFVIAALQPMAVTIIISIMQEDKAAMGAGYRPWEYNDSGE